MGGEDDFRAARERLDALSRRIGEKVRELKEHGGFSDAHEAFADRLRTYEDAVKARLDSALRKGDRWEAVKYEFERDYASMLDNFLQWRAHLDETAVTSRAAKSKPP